MNAMQEALDALGERAKQNIPIVEGDYIGENGLYYCGKCNTPKQTRIINPFTGEENLRHCICKCRQEQFEREEAERQRVVFEKRVKELRRVGFPDDEMKNWTFDKDDHANEHISKVARNYVDNFDKMLADGKGLLLYGNVGTGKTFAAACIVNALIDKGRPCLITNFDRIRNTLFGMYDGKQQYIDGFNRFALLVIDDLESESKTKDMDGIIYNIIDSRYRAGLPLIITTNLTGAELKQPADIQKQRIYSRLFEQCIPLEVKGADRRREKLKNDVKAYADILGL